MRGVTEATGALADIETSLTGRGTITRQTLNICKESMIHVSAILYHQTLLLIPRSGRGLPIRLVIPGRSGTGNATRGLAASTAACAFTISSVPSMSLPVSSRVLSSSCLCRLDSSRYSRRSGVIRHAMGNSSLTLNL